MSDPSTRDRLIAAAFVVVAREGLEAASVKAIAVEAGITAGLLHYHFPTKDALLEAALRQALDSYIVRVRTRREATARAIVSQIWCGTSPSCKAKSRAEWPIR